jgi:hypothetical protein
MSPYRTLPRVLGLAFVVVLAGYLLAVAFTPLTLGFGWVSGEANLRSFGKASQNYAEAYSDARAMDANATQACRLKDAVAQAKSAGDQNAVNQRESQLLAIENNYDRVRGEYDAYMQNHFQGGVIHPKRLPIPYWTLSQRQKALC